MTAATLFAHRPDCPRDRPTQPRRINGAAYRWCPSCDAQGLTAEAPSRQPGPLAGVVTRYTCREHLKPVNAAGKGCPACVREREQRRNVKAERRASR